MAGKTPWHLWIVALLMIVWNGFAAFDFTASYTHYEPYMAQVAAPVKDHLYALPRWTFAIWGLATWSGLVGSMMLLLRRADAVSLLGLSAAGAAALLVVAIRYPAPAGGTDPKFASLIVAVAVLLWLYASAMRKRGVLH